MELMSSGPYDWLLRIVPGLDGLRVPARAAILVFLSLTVLAALGVQWLTDRLSRTGARAWAFCLASTCVLVAEGYHPVSMVAFESSPDARAVYRWLGERLPGAVLELPFYGHGRGASEEQAMRFVHGTLEHGNPLVNGYSGYRTPLHYLLAGHALQDYESYGDRQHIDILRTFTVALGTLPATVAAGTPSSVTITITDDETPAVSLSA